LDWLVHILLQRWALDALHWHGPRSRRPDSWGRKPSKWNDWSLPLERATRLVGVYHASAPHIRKLSVFVPWQQACPLPACCSQPCVPSNPSFPFNSSLSPNPNLLNFISQSRTASPHVRNSSHTQSCENPSLSHALATRVPTHLSPAKMRSLTRVLSRLIPNPLPAPPSGYAKLSKSSPRRCIGCFSTPNPDREI